jgi:hypothetical protein
MCRSPPEHKGQAHGGALLGLLRSTVLGHMCKGPGQPCKANSSASDREWFRRARRIAIGAKKRCTVAQYMAFNTANKIAAKNSLQRNAGLPRLGSGGAPCGTPPLAGSHDHSPHPALRQRPRPAGGQRCRRACLRDAHLYPHPQDNPRSLLDLGLNTPRCVVLAGARFDVSVR